MKIKNILSALALCISLLTFTTSCEDMIKEKSYSVITPNDIPDSDEGASMWVNGTYSKLLDDMFRHNIFPTVLEFDCDYITGPDWAFGSFGAGNFQDGTDAAALWEKPYNLIHRANYSIENINKMKNLSPRHKENALGELYFLKAYSYFLLVRAFGPAIIRYESINASGQAELPREPVENVYGHIIDLLTEAQTLMYKNTDREFTVGKASAGAAASLLAKVYATIASGAMPSGNEVIIKAGKAFTMNGTEKMYTDPMPVTLQKNQLKGYEVFDYKAYYKLARIQAEKVIAGEFGSYELLPYDNLWKKDYKNASEHIWRLQTIDGDDRYGAKFSLGYAGIYNDQKQIKNGLWYGLRHHWYKLFESKDYRVSKGVLHRWQRSFDAVYNIASYYPDTEEYRKKIEDKEAPFDDDLDYVSNKDNAFIAYLTKYDDRTNKQANISDASWPFLRFADILLIHAEALAEETGTPNGDALESLNKVRRRSNATPKSLSGQGNVASIVDFRSAVLEERAMELALEGDRRWDLTRWGIYIDAMNSAGGTDEVGVYKARVKNKHELFPIPSSEMDANSLIPENNPGWS